MKNANELLQLGKNIANAYLQNGEDLTESLTKVAVANSLTKEEIHRVAEQANVETYLGLVTKTPDHYVQFNLANPVDSFYKAASIMHKDVEEDLDEYNDIQDIPFSLSMYKQKSKGDEVITKEASATIAIEQEISKLKDKINILQNEILVKKAELSVGVDKSNDMIKQAILGGVNFNNICELVKLATPLLGDTIINDFKKNFTTECPFVDLEKDAEKNLIPSKTSDLFQKLSQLDTIYKSMSEDINLLMKETDKVNSLIKENNAGDLVKISGVIKNLATIGLPLFAAGYIVGRRQKNPGNYYMTRSTAAQTMVNKNINNF
jgi:hypothetical protein